jgi:glycosyltransferase involved in cell wall biosynthesis
LATQQFDSVQLESSHLFSYLQLIHAAPSHPPVLLDWHNIESELMTRYASETKSLPKKLIAYRTATLLGKLEARLIRRCQYHTVVSEREQQKLLSQDPGAQVTVIPNGVDAKAFTPRQSVNNAENLLFVGSMDYHANIDAVTWFTKTAWPIISERRPHLHFTILGRSPDPAVRSLASDKVHVTGTVEDVRPFYANAVAVMVPLRVGGGTRLKILEAMAMGVPVISTTLGAEGILAHDGEDILFADSAEAMADALDRMLSQPLLRQRLIASARRLVSEHYDWSSIGDRLFHIHSKLIHARMSHSY